MSRLTDLQTIARGLAAPWAWSMLAVVPKVRMHIVAADSIVFALIHAEEEAIERERAAEALYERDRMAWRATEPVKPWREDVAYDEAMREWRAKEPKEWRYVAPPVK